MRKRQILEQRSQNLAYVMAPCSPYRQKTEKKKKKIDLCHDRNGGLSQHEKETSKSRYKERCRQTLIGEDNVLFPSANTLMH